MAKGLLFVAFTACLLATGHSQLPLDAIIKALTDTVGGLSGSVTGIVEGLVKSVTGILDAVVQVLTTTLNTLGNTVGGTLDAVLGAPLEVVNGLLATAKSILNPKDIVSGLMSALQPALKALTAIAKQLTGTTTCLVNTAVNNLTIEIIKGVSQTIKCANPFIVQATNVSKIMDTLVTPTLGIATDVVKKVAKCAQAALVSPDLGAILNCVVGTVDSSLQSVAKLVADIQPEIQNGLAITLAVPQCLQDVLLEKIKKAQTLLDSVVQCATSNGLNVISTQLSSAIPNFTEIAKIALAEINSITSDAVGPNGLINTLLDTLQQLKSVSEAVSVSAIKNAISSALKDIQNKINTLGLDPNNLPVMACVNDAQKAVNSLAEQALKIIQTNVASIAPEAANLVSDAGQLSLGLQNEAIKAAAEALQKCSGLATATDNSAQQCFDASVAAVKSTVSGLVDKVGTAIGTAKGLIKKTENSLSFGLAMLKADVATISATLDKCVSG